MKTHLVYKYYWCEEEKKSYEECGHLIKYLGHNPILTGHPIRYFIVTNSTIIRSLEASKEFDGYEKAKDFCHRNNIKLKLLGK